MLVPPVTQKHQIPLNETLATCTPVALLGNAFGLAHKILGPEKVEPPWVQPRHPQALAHVSKIMSLRTESPK
eukprot:5027061-Pyramimonas_sp.AAC.1